MPRQPSSVWTAKWLVTVGCVSLLVGAPVGCASAQGVPPELGQALLDFFERASRRGELYSVPPTQPGLSAPELPADGTTDFVLLGVVIAGETRQALLQDTAANPASAHLLPLGASLAGHRLTDVRVDQVTLERRDGRRVTVRLGAGGAVAQAVPSTPRPGRAETLEPASGGSEVGEPLSAQEKIERQARKTGRAAQDKARVLAQRAASGLPTEAPAGPHE